MESARASNLKLSIYVEGSKVRREAKVQGLCKVSALLQQLKLAEPLMQIGDDEWEAVENGRILVNHWSLQKHKLKDGCAIYCRRKQSCNRISMFDELRFAVGEVDISVHICHETKTRTLLAKKSSKFIKSELHFVAKMEKLHGAEVDHSSPTHMSKHDDEDSCTSSSSCSSTSSARSSAEKSRSEEVVHKRRARKFSWEWLFNKTKREN